MTELEALRERVGAATGADRDLDVAIWDWLENWPVVDGQPDWRVTPAGTTALATVFAPVYTASIDATLALVSRKLPGWRWGIDNLDGPMALLWNDTDTTAEQFGATAPLAILSALLSALIEKDAT